MAQNITLVEYANLKSSNINDIVQFAQSKGITIPSAPEYVLDDSILKQIDPIFHHNLKYGRKIGTTTNLPNNLKVIGTIDLTALNDSLHPKVKIKEERKNRC